ncbi:hypothetical protein HZY93_06640 [Streptococcus danieliae]|uniref:Uncharacterized protein n=1 Tax=Streptococcus danieliae TaxID=747656 RepID=A0A7Z0LDS1_9STRE|nr:hypothetical protein [Streptococcus danieliae]MBF0717702.1 hypothetical protein [Streptococcus danieliae]NYS49632.1 hypothetical protein [Streptococcus danieliae]
MNLKKHKLYFATFFTDMLSNFGDTVYSLALMNYVLLVPQKEPAIALVSISESLPILFSILIRTSKYQIVYIFKNRESHQGRSLSFLGS